MNKNNRYSIIKKTVIILASAFVSFLVLTCGCPSEPDIEQGHFVILDNEPSSYPMLLPQSGTIDITEDQVTIKYEEVPGEEWTVVYDIVYPAKE